MIFQEQIIGFSCAQQPDKLIFVTVFGRAGSGKFYFRSRRRRQKNLYSPV